MKTGRQHRTDQTSKHYIDKAEELRDKLAEQRRQKLYERLQQEWPEAMSICYDDELDDEQRSIAWITMMLDLSLSEKAVFWDIAHEPKTRKLFTGFFDHEGGQGSEFRAWINEGNEINRKIWHGGFLWRE